MRCNHVIATWQSRDRIRFIIFTNITIIFFLFLNQWSAVITCLDFAKGGTVEVLNKELQKQNYT